MNESQDPYLWLEEIDDEKALAWVDERSIQTKEKYSSSSAFKSLYEKILVVLDSNDRIPGFVAYGTSLYNFWQDADHPRGIWRRTTLEEYRKDEPAWHVLLDLDRLASEEDENWVWGGHSMLRPDHDRALVQLSRGGGDATVIREFDVEKRCFVEDGFVVAEAKSSVSWAGRDKILICTDFGPESTTDSGYPMTVCVWERGTPIETAQEIFRGQPSDVSVGASADHFNEYSEYYVIRATDFYTNKLFVFRDGQLLQVNKPDSANAFVHRGQLLVRLKSDWYSSSASFKAGSLLIDTVASNLSGESKPEVLFEPSNGRTLEGWGMTKDEVVLSVSENVRTKAYVAKQSPDGWGLQPICGRSEILNESVQSLDSHTSNQILVSSESFLVPTTLSLGTTSGSLDELKQAPAYFDASKLETAQHWATSEDGTKVPYFEIRGKDAAGPAPTLLYGYGGFEISLLPQYSGTVGVGWLERGGNYVVANIRGGGEFGPGWHHSALKEHRHRAYDDFIAVAEDLIERGVVGKGQLGIQGGSNGGLLMGNMYTRRPDLFDAIVCQVPLLDMSRYHLLLAGASWMAEYGDPEVVEEWSFLRNYSPYHNVDSTKEYPPILITTSTRDDRVHPGHARKMTAKLEEFGQRVDYYENTAGGHAGAADNSQRAFMLTLVYEFLWSTLCSE